MKNIHGIEVKKRERPPVKNQGRAFRSETHRADGVERLDHNSADAIEQRVNAAMRRATK
jgi:hypothetical protein